MKITNFVKKIINFDMKKKKKIACGGHPHRESSLVEGRSPTADCVGAKSRTKTPLNFSVVYTVSIGFWGVNVTPFASMSLGKVHMLLVSIHFEQLCEIGVLPVRDKDIVAYLHRWLGFWCRRRD